jgi:DNA-binding transcriptional ArsR family regulator
MVFSIATLGERADQVLQAAAEIFGVLSTPASLRIVRALADGPLSAGQLIALTGASRGGLAYHLQQLHAAGLVGKFGRGPQTRYLLQTDSITQACLLALNALAGSAQTASGAAQPVNVLGSGGA